MAEARTPVPAPPAAPPRVGLLAAAVALGRVVTDDTEWTSGFAYAPENCAGSGVGDPCGIDENKDIGDNADIVGAQPYYVWAGDQCSAWGFETRDFQGRAQRLLRACESKEIEAELLKGTLSEAQGWGNAFLASDPTEVNSAPEEALIALARLEQAMGSCSCGQAGMIHAPRTVVTLWDAQNLLKKDGPLLRTVHDTVVVAGAGYDGTGPGGVPAADGSVWVYGSPLVDIRLSSIQVVPSSVQEALDRATNTIAFRAERLAAATFDNCCHFAAEIDAPLPPAVGS